MPETGILPGVIAPICAKRGLCPLLAAACLLVLAGCSSFVTSVRPAGDTPTPRAAPTRAAQTPEPTPTSARRVTPTPAPTVSFSISDAPLQFWSNPNEVVGLVWDGECAWAATLGGVVRWWPDGHSQLYTTKDGLLSQAVAAIARDGDGHIWIAYRDVLAWSEHDGQAWQHYATRQDAVEARYNAMLAAGKGDVRLWSSQPDSHWLWLPRGDGQVQAFDGSRWRTYGAAHGVTPGSWGVDISSGGRVWAVGRGVATALEGELWWDDHAFISSIAAPALVTDLAVDPAGGAWVSFVGERGAEGGVARYNYELDRWEGFEHALNAAMPVQAYSVDVSALGAVTVCGAEGIVTRPPQGAWRAQAVPGVQVRCVAEGADGLLWLGSDNGVYTMRADGSDLSGPLTVPTPLRDNQVRALLVAPDGTLVVAGRRGLSLIRATGEVQAIDQTGLRCGVVDGQGRVWLAGDEGVWQLDLGASAPDEALMPVSSLATVSLAWTPAGLAALGVDGVVYRHVEVEPEAWLDATATLGAVPRNIAVDGSGHVWLSSEQGVGQLVPDGALQMWTRDDGLLSNDVRAVVVAQDGTLWCATAMGLARRTPEDRWTRFTVESTGGGLRSLDMTALLVEPDGTLWMATALGLSRRTPEADWSYYDLAGIKHLALDAQGTLWLGSDSGLYRLLPDALITIEE
ncbi:MAG: hypothetical protein ACOX3S_02375 [Anaerolineae bacterium]|jgi:ligand-binding sensor domain-containing protein